MSDVPPLQNAKSIAIEAMEYINLEVYPDNMEIRDVADD
jgi:hypothetical protein